MIASFESKIKEGFKKEQEDTRKFIISFFQEEIINKMPNSFENSIKEQIEGLTKNFKDETKNAIKNEIS